MVVSGFARLVSEKIFGLLDQTNPDKIRIASDVYSEVVRILANLPVPRIRSLLHR